MVTSLLRTVMRLAIKKKFGTIRSVPTRAYLIKLTLLSRKSLEKTLVSCFHIKDISLINIVDGNERAQKKSIRNQFNFQERSS
jgi:hypothetical protein